MYQKCKILLQLNNSYKRDTVTQSQKNLNRTDPLPTPPPCKNSYDLYQSQERPLTKVGWTCPPQSSPWRRPCARCDPLQDFLVGLQINSDGSRIYRWATMTYFRLITVLAGFRRHPVRKTLRNYATVTSLNYALLSNTIRCDSIRDAILTCAQKLTWVSSIYRTEPNSQKWKTEKLKTKITDMPRSIGKQSGGILEKKRKATVGRIGMTAWPPVLVLANETLQWRFIAKKLTKSQTTLNCRTEPQQKITSKAVVEMRLTTSHAWCTL